MKEELDHLPIFKEMEKLEIEIRKKKELVEKIQKYNAYPSDKIRLDIYSYEEIRKYKEKETELNLIILNINKRIKEGLLERDVDYHESN